MVDIPSQRIGKVPVVQQTPAATKDSGPKAAGRPDHYEAVRGAAMHSEPEVATTPGLEDALVAWARSLEIRMQSGRGDPAQAQKAVRTAVEAAMKQEGIELGASDPKEGWVEVTGAPQCTLLDDTIKKLAAEGKPVRVVTGGMPMAPFSLSVAHEASNASYLLPAAFMAPPEFRALQILHENDHVRIEDGARRRGKNSGFDVGFITASRLLPMVESLGRAGVALAPGSYAQHFNLSELVTYTLAQRRAAQHGVEHPEVDAWPQTFAALLAASHTALEGARLSEAQLLPERVDGDPVVAVPVYNAAEINNPDGPGCIPAGQLMLGALRIRLRDVRNGDLPKAASEALAHAGKIVGRFDAVAG